MKISRIKPNIQSERMDESQKFYKEFFGLEVAMDMGWIVTLVSPNNPKAQISLLKEPPSAAPQAQMSLTVEVVDVDAAHAKAVASGVPIIYPLTTESYGIRRFQVTDPNGVVINVSSHQK